MINNEIDIVIPWVDDSDQEWISVYKNYKADNISDNSEARYRDWNLFKYWFRSIQDNAAWVRKIHFVTFGHVPEWLDVTNPKISIVRHEDFIPKQYLPTFSSHVIELNMHRIPDLAEKFIYFNDDVYLTHPVEKEDFFIDEMPVDAAIMGVIKNSDLTNFMPYIMLNMMAIINMEFDKKEVIKRNYKKWYARCYGKDLLKNIYLSPWNIFPGFRNYHTCNAFLKTTFENVWDKYPNILNSTCMHKFRSKEDVNQYIMRYWQLCSGNFVPHKPNSNYVTIGSEPPIEIAKLMWNKNYKIVCLNDDPMEFDFEKEKKKIGYIMKKKYPQKSLFEK